MAERAAHLVDHVMPLVPTRQWVLTLPYRLRYRLGYDHELCKRVLRIYQRAVGAYYRSQTGQPTGEVGCVTFIHRFNSQQRPFALAPLSYRDARRRLRA